MSNFINHSYSFQKLLHYFKAGNEHDVHSPFVFDLLTKIIYPTIEIPSFENNETTLPTLIKQNDIGVILYKLIKYFQPSTMMDIGGTETFNARYLAAGNPQGEVYVLKIKAEKENKEQNIFQQQSNKNIQVIEGNIIETLPSLLLNQKKLDFIFIDGLENHQTLIEVFMLLKNHIHEDSIIIIDYIHHSSTRLQEWNEIIAYPSVSVSTDFFTFGILFFKKGIKKQHFFLRS